MLTINTFTYSSLNYKGHSYQNNNVFPYSLLYYRSCSSHTIIILSLIFCLNVGVILLTIIIL